MPTTSGRLPARSGSLRDLFQSHPPRALTLVFAVACGAVVANIYYAQPLVGLISPALELPLSLAGIIVTLTQLGYGLGLVLLVPLADLIENRRLVVVTLIGTTAGLVAVALSTSAAAFLAASLVMGFCSVGVQVLVPFAARITPEKDRGRIIGNVVGGLLIGVMLARPLASLVAAHFGWRAIFLVSGAAMLVLIVVLARALPVYRPRPAHGYNAMLRSTARLVVTEPVLRRRSAYQGLLFATFNLFWTAAPLMLHARFGLTQNGIALFALAGAGGALVAPFAGRWADRGLTRPATGLSIAVALLCFAGTGWATAAGALLPLALAAAVLDAGTQANHVLSQRAILALSTQASGRLNAVYMTIVFLCGAAGSALGGLTFAAGGWPMTVVAGVALTGTALLVYATEVRAKG